MTTLALRGSRFHNGVSKIHGDVASHMEGYLWPPVTPAEKPIQHVTNGVHLPTFLAAAWTRPFTDSFRARRASVHDRAYWPGHDGIPYYPFFPVRPPPQLVSPVYRKNVG